MAGIKGMKGGGGARPGAGRKRVPPDPNTEKTPLGFLLAVMVGRIEPNRNQMRAAIAALPYFHEKTKSYSRRDQWK